MMQKGKKFAGITQNLNRILNKSLESFSQNTEWTDINNWLLTLQSVLKDNPSPYITQKILLSKRLNQCMNPILPDKIHQCVLRIHQIMFTNMRVSVDGNINDYIKIFADDLGVYSISILPYFTHTSVRQHRMMILKLVNYYYLDLGKQLIPILPGFIKSILPVYVQVNDQNLTNAIQKILDKILIKVGRRYAIGVIWSAILKFKDCKLPGIKYLSKVISKMDFIKGEEDFSQSHGFSQEEEQLRRQLMEQMQRQKLQKQKQQPKTLKKSGSHQNLSNNTSNLSSPLKLPQNLTPIRQIEQQKKPLIKLTKQFNIEHQQQNSQGNLKQIGLDLNKINQESEQSDQQSNEQHSKEKYKKMQRKETFQVFNQAKTPHAYQSDQMLTSAKYFVTKNSLFEEQSSSIKLNKVPLMVSPGIQTIKDGVDSDIQENNFPNSNTLVINSLISCFQDQSQIVKRSALDFLFSHLRIKSQILTQHDKKLLIQAMISLFKKKQISITKRVNRWLFGKEDQQNKFIITQKNAYVIEYIVDAFKQILSKQSKNPQESIVPIKILQNFYIQHSNMVEVTLGQISMNLLRYIFNFGTKSSIIGLDSNEHADEVLKAGKRFLQNLPSYYSIIFKSLGRSFLTGLQNQTSQQSFEAIKYMDFCYINLMKHEHGIQELQYITLTLQALAKGLQKLSQQACIHRSFLKDSVLLFYNLVARRQSCQKYSKRQLQKINLKYFMDTGQQKLPEERIKYQKDLEDEQLKQQKRFIDILDCFQDFYIRLGTVIKTLPNIQIYQQPFKLASMAIVKLQFHLPKGQLDKLPKWFSTIQQGVKVSNPVVSLASIQAIINIMLWQQKHPRYYSLKMIVIQQKNKKVGSDYQKLALQKLWSLLDFPHMHSKIIDLIVGFSQFFPNQFTQTVKKSFSTHNAPQKQASIQRFSHFWRLTGFKYKDLLFSNRQFGQLNKVGLFLMLDFLDDQNPLVRHAAKTWLLQSMPMLNRIMQPLLFQLVKNCSDWYETPKGVYLIKTIYDTDHIFNTIRRIKSILSNGSYGFLRYIYQTQISQNLDQHKSKITDLKIPFLTAQSKQQIEVKIVVSSREPVLSKALQKQLMIPTERKKNTRMAYFDLLIIVIIKYIEGHAIQSMGIDFYIGNSGVNASAVQFLLTMMDYIDNHLLCEKIIKFIAQPLFKVLRQVVLNRQYIMQIQILNLLQSIFFSSSFRKKAEAQKIRQFFKLVFTDKTFLSSVLQGLHTPFSYVRSQFISFITTCIPLIADFLQPSECTQCIRHIIFTYYKIIKELKVNFITDVLQEQNQLEQQEQILQSKGNMLLYSRVVELQSKIKKQENFVKLSDNLNQVAKTNQTLSVLHGLSSILNYFYDLNKLNVKQLNFQFTNPYTFFDTFKTIVTLGLASSQKDGKLVEKRQFLHNLQTCQAILQDLTPVYQTILRSWPLSQEYVRISTQQFSSIGIKSFNFQRFSSYNKVVKDLICYVQEQSQSIWGKIFSIMQPMFYKFPKQINDIYLKLWIRECQDVADENGLIRANHQKTQFLMKIIQTIIVNDFPMNVVIHAILESSPLQQITTFYQKNASSKKGNVLNYQINKSQSKLLYFIYVYLNYVHLNQKELNKEKLLEIWSLIMKVLKPFQKSKSPIVAIWILQVINLGSRKYSPKQLLSNEKFKSDLHRLIKDKLNFIARVASKSQHFFFRQPMSKVSFAQQDSTPQYHLVLPLPPTIYQIFKLKSKQKNYTDKQTFKACRPGEIIQLQAKYRFYCFKVLKKIGLEILQNTYLPQKMHWAIIRASEWLDIILPVIQDKNTHNMIFAECASQVLYDILQKARILFIQNLKPKVLAIFNKDDFFICNQNTLSYWAKIMDWIVSMDRNNQTFSQYLQKVSLSSSYFANQSAQNKKRIKSFQRICFILYSGCKDKYALRIKGLLQKIADVIRMSQNVHPALLILILFAIRILILKLSEISLNQLFIDIWPMILALLMQIFQKQYVRVNLSNEISKNPNLLLAALKLIQMISLTNLGEFAHHQWIFIYDYFGLSLSVPQMTADINGFIALRPQLGQIIKLNTKGVKSSPFIFKPSLMSHMPTYSISYKNQKKNQEQIAYDPLKRILIIKQSFVADQGMLNVQAMFLMQYLNYLNQYRTQVDWQQVQNLIINDFIKLDSFIHQVA